jgi:hypothetical protein
MPSQRQAGLTKLAIALAAMACVWLVVLPLVSQQRHVSEHIQQQEQLGIDPSAMFYSELEILPAIAHRVERLRLSDPATINSRNFDSSTREKRPATQDAFGKRDF